MDERIVGTTIPHSDFGDPKCCGCLNGIIRGDQAHIVCNECVKIVRTVPASDLRQALDEMELGLDVAAEKCPYCGAVHIAPGFSILTAYVCDNCGKGVNVSDQSG